MGQLEQDINKLNKSVVFVNSEAENRRKFTRKNKFKKPKSELLQF